MKTTRVGQDPHPQCQPCIHILHLGGSGKQTSLQTHSTNYCY